MRTLAPKGMGLGCYKWYGIKASHRVMYSEDVGPKGDGFGLLQMVSKLVIVWCAMRTLAPRGWIVRFHDGWRGERNISYKKPVFSGTSRIISTAVVLDR